MTKDHTNKKINYDIRSVEFYSSKISIPSSMSITLGHGANLKEVFTFYCVTSSCILCSGSGSHWSLQMPAERGNTM